MILPNCTILIPTRNRAQELEETARLLCECGLSGTPIIIVDDASEDPDATEAAVVALENCRVIRQTKRTGQAGARNVGLRASATTYALLLDDDAHPDNPEALAVFLDARHEGVERFTSFAFRLLGILLFVAHSAPLSRGKSAPAKSNGRRPCYSDAFRGRF